MLRVHGDRKRLGAIALALAAGAALVLVDACSGNGGGGGNGGADAGGSDATTVNPDSDGAIESDAPAAAPVTVKLSYRPSWDGVIAVSVIGGFGRSDDWKPDMPAVALKNDGAGNWRGSIDLPPGNYLYLLRVVGDAESATPNQFVRYALDPASAAFAACPSDSPTYSKTASMPCSKLAVPSSSSPLHHARGVVLVDGKPAEGYLVVLERNEVGSLHFFVDRTTTRATGAYDLAAAPGLYRVQIWHPTYLSMTDAARDPVALAALRRTISSNFQLSADDTLPTVDLAYHGYETFSPQDAATLPTHFTFSNDAGIAARLAIYGGNNVEIGDPWYLAPQASTTGADFDGGFNTRQAGDPSVKPDAHYFWGTEEVARGSNVDGGVRWSGQTMVFPIHW